MSQETMAAGREVGVRCLITFGDQAHLYIDGQDEPVLQPAVPIAGELGVEPRELPGKRLTATLTESRETGRVLSAFRPAGCQGWSPAIPLPRQEVPWTSCRRAHARLPACGTAEGFASFAMRPAPALSALRAAGTLAA